MDSRRTEHAAAAADEGTNNTALCGSNEHLLVEWPRRSWWCLFVDVDIIPPLFAPLSENGFRRAKPTSILNLSFNLQLHRIVTVSLHACLSQPSYKTTDNRRETEDVECNCKIKAWKKKKSNFTFKSKFKHFLHDLKSRRLAASRLSGLYDVNGRYCMCITFSGFIFLMHLYIFISGCSNMHRRIHVRTASPHNVTL